MGTGKQQIKIQGTCKLNTYCKALIKTMTEQSTGKVQVEVCDTHYRHTTDLGHIHLPHNVRLSVAGQLLQGVSFQQILEKVHDSVGTDLKGVHLISRKDIGNIEKSYHLNTKQRDKNDATSMECWVKELNDLLKADGGDLDIIETRQHIVNQIQTITTLVKHCTDKQTLQTINTQLGTTIELMKCHLEQTKPVLPPTQHEPVNKTIAPQRPFFSTCKRQKNIS